MVRLLGAGGMGSVYLATEVALGRRVAVKVLSPSLALDEQSRLRFEREARAAAAVSHPNVVQVYTVGETAGDPPLPYIIMQYVEGTPLDEVLRSRKRLPERHARRLLRDVAAALSAAHASDLIHRDIKPANILIEGASGRAYVADFGISAALSPRGLGGAQPPAEEGLIIGTPLYMSPEQAVGDVLSPQSDVYSLGVVAYEVLSGTLPFASDSPAAWAAAHLSVRSPPLRERRKAISGELARLVDRCLATEPVLRPVAADLVRELLPSAEDEILWPPPGLKNLPRLGHRLRAAAVILIAATAVLLGALAAPLPGVHGAAGWWESWAGGSVIATSSARAPEGWTVVLWQVTVLLGSLTLVLGLSAVVALLARTQRAFRELEARGWRRDTIHDALADPDGRTGLLLAGSGEFATMTSASRDRIRRFRRQAHAGLLAGAGWIGAALAAWAVSVLTGSPLEPAGGPPVGFPQLLVMALPLSVALSATGVALARERFAVGASWRRPHTGSFAVPEEFGAEELAEWYAELPRQPGPTLAREPPPPPLRRSIELGAALLTAWIILTVGLLATSTLLAARLARRLGPETARVAFSVARGETGRALRDAAIVLRRYLPGRRTSLPPPDTLLAGLLAEPPRGLPLYPVEPRVVLGTGQSGVAATTLVADALTRAKQLSSDTLSLLAALADHPRTRRLRKLARTLALTLPEEGNAPTAIRTALEANAAGAVLAASRGDLTGAAGRLGENGAIAELALAGPGRSWPQSGLRLLQSLVLLPLAEVERLRGNPDREGELRRAAVAVVETIDRFGPAWTVGAIGLASDPRDLRLLRRLDADSTVPAGLRTAAVEASGDAVCLNPREVLAGEDLARRAQLGGVPVVPEMFRARGIARVVQRIRYCAGLADN